MKKEIVIFTPGGFFGGSEKTLYNFLKTTTINKERILVVLPLKIDNGLCDKIRRLGVGTFVVGIDKDKTFSNILIKNICFLIMYFIRRIIYFMKVIYILIKVNPKVVYLNNIYCDVEAIASFILNKKIIWHIKGTGMSNRFIERIRYLLILKLSSKVIALTNSDKNKILKYCKIKYSNKIEIIPEGIDAQIKASLEKDKENFLREILGTKNVSNKIIVGMVSNLIYLKGIDLFADIAKSIVRKNKDVIFVHIGGKGVDQSNYYFRRVINISKEILNKNLFFLGFKDDILEHMNLFDIFFFPTRAEGQPLVVMEAMLLGKAVLTSAVDGNLELIKDTISGMLFQKGNIEEMKNKLNKLILDNKLRKFLGDNAKKKIIKEFRLENSTRKLERVIMKSI